MEFSTVLNLIPSEGGHDAICSVKYPGIGQARVSKWYLSKMIFYVNDQIVADFDLGQNVAADPIIGIHLGDLNPGDKVAVSWIDVRGLGDSQETLVQ